jgi:PAS domain S-box
MNREMKTSSIASVYLTQCIEELYLFVRGKHYSIKAGAITDLQAPEIFCTDVFFSMPPNQQFSGLAKTIIHPEDAEKLDYYLTNLRLPEDVDFRIITPSGSLRKIRLNASSRIETESIFNLTNDLLLSSQLELKQLQQKELLLNEHRKAVNIVQLYTDTGNWHYNEVTGDTYYSDNCYRIFGLPAQGLNAHPNTFTRFIHPEDALSLNQAIETTLAKHLPLHLSFRIIRQDGVVRHLSQTTYWAFNEVGQNVVYGLIEDTTEKTEKDKEGELKSYSLIHTNTILQQILKLYTIANFEYHYHTKAFYCSSNLQKIAGIKDEYFSHDLKSIFQIGDNSERQKLEDAYNDAINNKVVPDLEFKTLLQDGKSKYLKLTCRIVETYDGDCLIGFLKDITLNTAMQLQIDALKEQSTIQKELSSTIENSCGTGTLLFDYSSTNLTASDNCLRLFDQRTKTGSLTKNDLVSRVHNDDKLLISSLFTTPFTENEKQVKVRIPTGNKVRSLLATVKPLQSNPQLMSAIFYDITAVEDLTNRINDHSSTMRQIADNSEDALLILDDNYCIKFWNNKCDMAFQVKEDAAIGMNFFEIAPGLKRSVIFDAFQRALNGETILLPIKAELPVYKSIEINISPFKDHNENITGLVLLLKGTAVKGFNHAVNHQSNLINNVLELSCQSIIVLDNNMNYLYWNKKAEEDFGVTALSILGKNILEFFPFEDYKEYFNGFRKVLKGETVIIPSVYNEKFTENILAPVKDENGYITMILWITRH